MPLDQALLLLEQYTYLVLFPLAIMEGPIITVIAGFMVATGLLNPFIVYAIIVIGDMLGDVFWYLLGRFGGKSSYALRIRAYFGLGDHRVESLREQFERHRYKMMLTSKLVYGIGSAGLFTAGLVRVPYLVFATTCLIISLAQAAFFLGIGILFGESYKQIAVYLDYVAEATLVIGFFLVLYVGWNLWRRRS